MLQVDQESLDRSMSAYTTQFGYTYPTPASQLLVGSQSGGTPTGGSSGCCEGGRTIMTDPVSGQPVCSCQYDRLAIGSYSRLGTGLGASGGMYGATYPSTEQNPYPSIGMDSSAFYSPLSSGYGMKEAGVTEMSMYGTGLAASPTTYYTYDPTAFPAYGYDLAARRKNATRESTATLKAWLNEHKKNPYPTKGEKIMLAIITKMTLTQVSTWFANARRRLKKENKMTWEPRNKTDDDDAKLSDDDDEEKDICEKDDEEFKKDEKDLDAQLSETKVEDCVQTDLKSCDGTGITKPITAALSPNPQHANPFVTKGEKSDCAVSLSSSKPKIWSLADTAACKTPPPNGAVAAGAAGWLAGGTTFPLPPTIPPAQSNYSRFSHLMTGGVNPSQYMAGYSSGGDGVGTDTPPQTPPNAKGSNGSSNSSQSSLIASNGFLAASNGYPENMGGVSLSSCSRGSAVPMGSSSSGDVGTLHQRYQTGNGSVQSGHVGGSQQNGPMASTAFSPVYKSHPSRTPGGQQQPATLSPQHPQQLQCSRSSGHQPNQVQAGPYAS